METTEFKLYSRAHGELYGKKWMPTEAPKAVLALVHGFGEHIGRYEAVAKFWCERGIGFYGYDLAGHGRSGGKRGRVKGITAVLNDTNQFIDFIAESHPSVPIVLYGHSMGGNLALGYLEAFDRAEIKAAIITSPWLQLYSVPSKFERIVAEVLAKPLPNFAIPSSIPSAELSNNAEVGKAYEQDPLVHNKISLRLFTGIEKNAKELMTEAFLFSKPLLLMHGEADKITDCPTTKKFGQANQSPTLFVKWWPEMKHELHNEIEQDKVLEYMYDFVVSMYLVE